MHEIHVSKKHYHNILNPDYRRLVQVDFVAVLETFACTKAKVAFSQSVLLLISN